MIDGGDMLQGSPSSYYLNYIDGSKRHRVAEMCNFIGYDVSVIGNHDIECGKEVYDNYVDTCTFPVLCANAISHETGEPYFEPYTIIYRCGVRIAVIGVTTPAIPHWVPRKQWDEMYFDNPVETLRKWIDIVNEREAPDYVVALIHSGFDEGIKTAEYNENCTLEVAENVPGIDLILYGHDHSPRKESVVNIVTGKSVCCVNPGCNANCVAEVDIKLEFDEQGALAQHNTECNINYIGAIDNLHAHEYKAHFARDFRNINRFASEKIGSFTCCMDITDAYFGPSTYIDTIQQLQLDVSGADITFAAPLYFRSFIEEGEVMMSDFFKMCRFEDHLYILRLFGREIKSYLEMSYDLWINTMNSAESPMLKIEEIQGPAGRWGFSNFIFNFDSAAGIRYDVDLRRNNGERIVIHGMSDGRDFYVDKEYLVAITGYRCNGGGELLTRGAGLTKEEIERRIVSSSEHDIRHYLTSYIRSVKEFTPTVRNDWKFLPVEWAEEASKREKETLFSSVIVKKD